MSYEATFDFDLCVPAAKVAAMEKEFFRVLREDDEPEFTPGSFCKEFNEHWGEGLAEEEDPAPLMALASESARGNIYISGVAYKKWRSWEESMMESIAEFIQDGGTVSIDGEDDYRGGWEFDGECMSEWAEEYIHTERREELEGKEKELEEVKARLEQAEELLIHHISLGRIERKTIDLLGQTEAFLKERSALNQLAEAAE